jgi:hypothetical protein
MDDPTLRTRSAYRSVRGEISNDRPYRDSYFLQVIGDEFSPNTKSTSWQLYFC